MKMKQDPKVKRSTMIVLSKHALARVAGGDNGVLHMLTLGGGPLPLGVNGGGKG